MIRRLFDWRGSGYLFGRGLAGVGWQGQRPLVAAGDEGQRTCADEETTCKYGEIRFHGEILQHGGGVEEREFVALADEELARLEAALERLHAVTDADWDYEMKPGGILELEFADDSKIIINRHAAAREIWIAARAGGFHFRPPESMPGQWLDSRSGQPMAAVLSRCMSEQAGTSLQAGW